MQNKKGFSLFELMIVIAIIAILSAITVPNLISWYRNQGLRTAVVELQSNLHLAKMAAVKQNQNCTVFINSTAGSYNIDCINKTVSLGTYSGGVVFVDTEDEKTADEILYTSRGISNLNQTIYLTNIENSAYYRIQILIYGGVATSRKKSVSANWE